jgi:anaerobic magnesium-protoporphyrin IX monomethyl ester cyclase
MFLTNARLTELPFPARHLVDVSSYHYEIEGFSAISLIAQLGCPFSCGFCGGRESPMLRRIRTRTSKNIVDEIVHIWKSTGRCGFMLYDDELNVNKGMTELMNLIAQTQRDLGVEWRLRGFIKSQLFNDEQADVMRKAGFRWILTGFESGSERILENINKRATLAENTRCVEIARRHDLKVKALMSIGHPGESADTIQATKSWLISIKPEDFDASIITTYPGTPYYDHALPHTKPGEWVYTYERTGDRLFQFEIDHMEVSDYYKGDPEGGYRSYVYTDYLAPEDLVWERDNLEREVRKSLNIPFNPSSSKLHFEHSMGMGGPLPPQILRVSR